jgi:hypothetical protein
LAVRIILHNKNARADGGEEAIRLCFDLLPGLLCLISFRFYCRFLENKMLDITNIIHSHAQGSMVDLDRIFQRAVLIRKIEERAEDTFDADEEEITQIQADLTEYRQQIRLLDADT